jgi:hypothetical protein
MHIAELLREIEEAVGSSPSVDRLRAIREALDDPAFEAAVVEYVKGLNDPDSLSDVLARLRRLKRQAEDRAEDRKLHADLAVRIGVTTGVGLIAGGIVAAVSAMVPLLMMIPVAGGGWMAGTGYFGARRLNEESQLYRHLAERLTKLSEAAHAP